MSSVNAPARALAGSTGASVVSFAPSLVPARTLLLTIGSLLLTIGSLPLPLLTDQTTG
jgi:hypothetical protein